MERVRKKNLIINKIYTAKFKFQRNVIPVGFLEFKHQNLLHLQADVRRLIARGFRRELPSALYYTSAVHRSSVARQLSTDNNNQKNRRTLTTSVNYSQRPLSNISINNNAYHLDHTHYRDHDRANTEPRLIQINIISSQQLDNKSVNQSVEANPTHTSASQILQENTSTTYILKERQHKHLPHWTVGQTFCLRHGSCYDWSAIMIYLHAFSGTHLQKIIYS